MYSSVSLLHPRVLTFASPEEEKTGHCCIIRRELNPDEVLNKKKKKKKGLFQTKLEKKQNSNLASVKM